MVDPNDWRLAPGFDEAWRGAQLRLARWASSRSVTLLPSGETQAGAWDHDHCSFCWLELCDEEHDSGDGRRSVTEGYVTRGPVGVPPEQQRDDYHWVCRTCFNDFKDHFGWTEMS